MNTQKVRMLLVVALLAVMMVAGNVFPAAKVAPPPGCSYHGIFYPLGTVLPVAVGSGTDYMRCEYRLAPGGLTPQWVVYDNYPS